MLLGHRQAFAWLDDWYSMSIEDVRVYETTMQNKTNNLVQQPNEKEVVNSETIEDDESNVKKSSPNNTPKSPEKKSMFSWF